MKGLRLGVLLGVSRALCYQDSEKVVFFPEGVVLFNFRVSLSWPILIFNFGWDLENLFFLTTKRQLFCFYSLLLELINK